MNQRQRLFAGMGAVALSILASALPILSQSRKLNPVDEGPRDRSFVRFREKLLQAARRRDRRYIWSIVDPQIDWSFGAERGKRGFVREWADPESGLEAELIRMLSLGGEFEKKTEFCAPYVFTAWPEDDRWDAFEYEAIIAKGVNVRQRPDRHAPVIATLTFDIVKVSHEKAVTQPEQMQTLPKDWVRILTPSGKQGYVSRQYIRSPIDYRACFQKKRGRWWMTMFIAGD